MDASRSTFTAPPSETDASKMLTASSDMGPRRPFDNRINRRGNGREVPSSDAGVYDSPAQNLRVVSALASPTNRRLFTRDVARHDVGAHARRRSRETRRAERGRLARRADRAHRVH